MRDQQETTTTTNDSQLSVLCSEWCYIQWEAAITKGDTEAANNYMKMYELWKERGQ